MNEKPQKTPPSIDEWLKEAKADPLSLKEGMFLIHNGTVRQTPRAKVRQGIDDGSFVEWIDFSYDGVKVDIAVAETLRMDGIFHVRTWLNEGRLFPGDNIMYVLIGGDIRPNVIDALQFLVGKIKDECVKEIEKLAVHK